MQKYFSPVFGIPGIMTGILTYYSTIGGDLLLLIMLGLIFTVPMLFKRIPYLRGIALMYAWSLLGYGAAWHEARTHTIFYAEPGPHRIKGIVSDYLYCAHMRYPHRLTLTLESPYAGPALYLYTNFRTHMQPCALGDYITTPPIRLKKPPTSFGLYLIKEDIVGALFAPHDTLTITHAPQKTFFITLHEMRLALFARIQALLSPEHFALYSALFLGNKQYDKDKIDPINTQFRIWGIAHIFARSGIHIAIIISTLLFALSYIPIPYAAKMCFALFISLLYAGCSWSAISFARALCMFLCASYCIIMRRSTTAFHLLGITAMGVLLWHPLNLFFLDFQLSFALTGALIWISYQQMAQRTV